MSTHYTGIYTPTDELDKLLGISNKEEDDKNEEDIYLRTLDDVIVDLTVDIPEPPPIISQEGVTVFSEGNISAIVGQAKSRKTFLVAAITAAYLKSDGFLTFSAGEDVRPVLYVDTEQSDYHVNNVLRRIQYIAGMDKYTNDPRLKALKLREYGYEDRLKYVLKSIERFKPALVVLDGVGDLVADVNDANASSALITILMRYSKMYKCSIINVLHNNPGSMKSRGHLGSEIERKSETVLMVERDGNTRDVSKVKFCMCRNLEGVNFSFRVNRKGIPELVETPQTSEEMQQQLRRKLESIMPDYPATMRYSDLRATLMDSGMKERTASRSISRAANSGIIVKNKVGAYYLNKEITTEENEIPF
jgi:hypothetical protein